MKKLILMSTILFSTACSPISGREFGNASTHEQNQYCKAETLRTNVFNQEFDNRCEIYRIIKISENHVNDLCDGEMIICDIREEV